MRDSGFQVGEAVEYGYQVHGESFSIEEDREGADPASME